MLRVEQRAGRVVILVECDGRHDLLTPAPQGEALRPYQYARDLFLAHGWRREFHLWFCPGCSGRAGAPPRPARELEDQAPAPTIAETARAAFHDILEEVFQDKAARTDWATKRRLALGERPAPLELEQEGRPRRRRAPPGVVILEPCARCGRELYGKTQHHAYTPAGELMRVGSYCIAQIRAGRERGDSNLVAPQWEKRGVDNG